MYIYLQMIESPEDKILFEEVYIRYKNLMFKIAYDILHSEASAEDAVHDAFMYIAENIQATHNRTEKEIIAYIVEATRGRAYNIYNKTKRLVSLNTDIDDSDDSDYFKVESTYVSDIGLNEALKQLPQNFFDILALHYVVGYKTKEIAELMGIKQDSVQKRIKRAKDRLKEIMEGMEKDSE